MLNSETIIVGGGSAGCVLAARLAAIGKRVALIEPPTREAAEIDRLRPARWLKLLGGDEDWDFPTSSIDSLSGRSLNWPRGRGLGGSSRINAMIWFPPTEDDWQRFADPSVWGIERLREAFREVEAIVRPEPPRWLSESSKRFLDAAEGIEPRQGRIYRRVNRGGRRWNPANMLDDRVEVVRAQVDRVAFDGDRAIGVELVGGERLECSGDVVLSAGTIGSPAILLRSGIGPADVLRNAKIDVRVDLPGVGANLQDHLVMPVIFAVDRQFRFPDRPTVRDVTRWQTVGSGPLASNIAECGGLFLNQQIQIHVTPTHYLTYPGPDAAAAMTIAVNAALPKSRGRLSITSADPRAKPTIDPNYLNDPADLESTIGGIRLAREIANRSPLATWVAGELLPGAKRTSDEAITRAIRRFSQTLYHPAGTCALGDVTDEHLCVRGVQRLRVVDASVLKSITMGNPNAMAMTVAMAVALQESP